MATPERVVLFRPRTIFSIIGIALLVFLALALVYLAWRVITWILIASFLAAALNPAVEFFERRGMRRGGAAAIVAAVAIGGVSGLAYLVLPPLVEQVTDFVEAVPGFVEDLTQGRGPLGFLQTDYQIVDRIREAIDERGAGGVLGLTEPAVAVAQSVVTAVVGVVTILFLTVFMLLQGRQTIERFMGLLPESTRARWQRVASEIYRAIGGYVSGNLLISLIAGVASGVVLFAVGTEFAVALAVIVAILDLVPLAGATLAAFLVTTVVFIELGWVRGVIVGAFFLVYQQLENHFLQPVIYGRTVQLSPLAVLVAVLIGAELAGILGALMAIPIAGTLQAIVREILLARRAAMIATPNGVELPAAGPEDEERPPRTG